MDTHTLTSRFYGTNIDAKVIISFLYFNTNFFPFCPNKQRLMLLTYRWRPTWPKDRDKQRMQSNRVQASSHSRLFPIFPYNEKLLRFLQICFLLKSPTSRARVILIYDIFYNLLTDCGVRNLSSIFLEVS